MIDHLQKTNSINNIKVVFSVQNGPFILLRSSCFRIFLKAAVFFALATKALRHKEFLSTLYNTALFGSS